MRTALLFSLLLLFGTSISAQSLRDSISFRITSFVDKDNVGHYTDIQFELKNHTKDFKYGLVAYGYQDYDIRFYWGAVVEVECEDGQRHIATFSQLFELPGRRTFLLPNQSLTATCRFPLSRLSAKYNGSRVARFRFYSIAPGVRSRNCEEVKDWHVYRSDEIATDWVDITTPDFDFLRK